jgi:hypothetical protein
MNSFSEAIDYFDKALIIDPKNKIVLKWKENAFFMHKIETNLRILKQAILPLLNT